jgi:hypothetical protein
VASCSDHKVVAVTGRGGSDIVGGDGGEVPSNDGLCTGPVCDVWGDQGDGTYLNPILWADYNTLDAIAHGMYLHKMSWDGTTVIGDGTVICPGHHFTRAKAPQTQRLLLHSCAHWRRQYGQ